MVFVAKMPVDFIAFDMPLVCYTSMSFYRPPILQTPHANQLYSLMTGIVFLWIREENRENSLLLLLLLY